jgi:hypothetical protein
MADEPQTSVDEKGGNGFFKELSRSAIKRALAPLAATAATAGTAYLTRKATQVWNESVLPKVRDKGGGKAFAKDGLEQAARKLPGGRGAELLRDLAKRLDGEESPSEAPGEETEASGTQTAEAPKPNARREQERRERKQRREQRERALEKSRST